MVSWCRKSAGIATLFCASVLLAQPADTWVKIYGDVGSNRAYSVCQVSDGGYIVAGRTTSLDAGTEEVYLMRLDDAGDTLWTKTYGDNGGELEDRGYSVLQTPDKGCIIAGFTRSFGAGEADVWLIRTDASGDTLWTKTYGDENPDTAFCILQTTDGGYVIVGCTSSFGGGSSDAYLIKTDASGEASWTKTYGGAYDDKGSCVCLTPDGGYIIAGSTDSYGAWDEDVYLVKTDEAGDTLWTKTYGGVYDDWASAICPGSDMGYVVAGCTWSSGLGRCDVYILKLDEAGDTLWTKTYGGTLKDEGLAVCRTEDDGYIITGYSFPDDAGYEDLYLVKVDKDGDSLWTRRYGGDRADIGHDVLETTDGGYLVAGRTRSFGAGRCDVYLIKTDSDGHVGIEDKNIAREPFFVLELEPNPFTQKTSIEYHLSLTSHVRIDVYDPLGRKQTTLLDSPRNAGDHILSWDGRDDTGNELSSGGYFMRFASDERRKTVRLIIVK